jgi:hypothetical protein
MADATLRFKAYAYSYDKGADGRIDLTMKTWVQEGHRHPDDRPALKVDINLDTCFYGMTHKTLLELSKWARYAANYVKKLRECEGYPGEDANNAPEYKRVQSEMTKGD